MISPCSISLPGIGCRPDGPRAYLRYHATNAGDFVKEIIDIA